MSVQGMNHFTVLSDDLEVTKNFYCDLLGLEPGPLHEHRAGVIDHMAFTATDLQGTVAKLEKAGVTYELRRLPKGGVGEGLWQLFFDDPHGGKVEFDFDKSEPAPASYAA